MEFNDTILVAASRERVWQALSNPEEIGPCIPGLETVEIYDEGRAFGGQASVKLGSSALTFPARVAWIEREAPNGGRLQASARLAGYDIKGEGVVTLDENGKGETTLRWQADVVVPDELAENPLMAQMARMFAGRFLKGFFECVEARLASV